MNRQSSSLGVVNELKFMVSRRCDGGKGGKMKVCSAAG